MNPYVLYVDDDSANLVVFQSGLSGALPILTATSGEEALALLKQHEVAVLLADQRMPGMTGVQLMEKVRAEHPDVVRLLITAYSDLEASIDAINKGKVDAYFKKPWEPAELTLALTQARDRYIATKWTRELERRLVATERTYALGVVAAGIAHELRNPLTSVSLCLQLARQLLKEKPFEDEQRQAADRNLVDATRAVEAIIEITAAMELSTRQREVASIDLKETVELAIRSVLGEVKARGRLVKELSEVPRIRASRTQVGQVVLNLLINAAQALDEARRSTNVVKVSLKQEGPSIVLKVSDTGAGIPEEVLGRIFDPFFTTKQDGGTGLGLAISRQIVNELGGAIDVDTVPGQGTTFRVRLPVPEVVERKQ
ncbi:MAG: response regulator [Myxococcales bacterium]|nr:response regulator [Myxococcales bacterium]